MVKMGWHFSSLGSRTPCCLFLFGILKGSSMFLARKYCFKGLSSKMLWRRHSLSMLLSTIWPGSCRWSSGRLWLAVAAYEDKH